MRSTLVVVQPPASDQELGADQTSEPVDIEVLTANATVEALDEGVLDRLTRADELQMDVVVVHPLIQKLAAQFRPIVEHGGWSVVRLKLTIDLEGASHQPAAVRSVSQRRDMRYMVVSVWRPGSPTAGGQAAWPATKSVKFVAPKKESRPANL